MSYFTGTDVYGLRWWVMKPDDNNDNFISRIRYMEKYDTIMTKEQIQHSMTEYEKIDAEEMEHLSVQVFVYNKILEEYTWWHVDKHKIHSWLRERM